MAYTITLTDGTIFATIADGTVNTSSSMTLIGKNYAGYGDFLDENFIHLLENSSNTTAPTAPLTGQLWYDQTNKQLKVYKGSDGWKPLSGLLAQAGTPSNAITGDLWFDTTNQQLKAWTGSAWIVIGPVYSSSQGTSGAIPETITDSVGTNKLITSLYVNNNRVGVVYDLAQFIPQASLQAAFPTIYPGITLSSAISGARLEGTANNSTYLNNLLSTSFMRSDANTSTSGTLNVLNDTGLAVGTSNAVSLSQSSNDAVIKSSISGGNIVLQANVGGTVYNVARGLGANGTFAIANAATVGTTLGVVGNLSAGNISTANVNTTTLGVTTINATTLNTLSAAVTANVDGGNLRTGGLVSATGNITSAANITASYYFGNGSQLTGLSQAVSLSKINNGTSEANIGSTGGNANISIGGTANVAVFTTTGIVVTGITTPDITKSGTNAVGNIGSSSNYFNRVFATSTSALYADVAERFAADEYLAPGTVVELGGVNEITKAVEELTDDVFGVISTRAAYLMNGGAGEDDTHPPVAMTGRVPVLVKGPVRKGQRLVSAGHGVARAAEAHEITAFNVIGRALKDKTTETEELLEAIVTIK